MKNGVRFGSLLCFVLIISLCLALSFTTVPVMAGQKPSVESCNEMGMLDISCHKCDTGDYLGKISVQAEYDAEYGDCANRYREARRKCSEFYNLERGNTAARWSHSMGGTVYSGSYPASCKK